MEPEFIDKAINYFESVKEQFGDVLFLESDDINEIPNVENEIISSLPQENMIVELPKESKSGMNEYSDWKESKSIPELNEKINQCTKCALGNTRKNFVFGSGNPNADIMIIGEAPGADEDEQGLPFVGRAGQLLTKILEAIKLSRDEVFIANILKCRPPDNRKPLASEEDACEPYLIKQIELIKPQFILALGLTAVDCLLKKKHKMGEVSGKLFDYHGVQMIVTYHPSALLRNPNWKPQTWEDVKLLRKLYDEYLISKNN